MTLLSDRLSLIGLTAAFCFVLIIFVRYPGDTAARSAHMLYAGVAAALLLGLIAVVAYLATRRDAPETRTNASAGDFAGLIAGFLWVLEISFNNFVDPRISTGMARFYVDNTAWALVALLILAASFFETLKTGRFVPGIGAGTRSGFISGLMACLMGLLMVVAWMPFLLRDPLNIQEYAQRGVGGMPAYLAYETMAGALGHLIVLGVAMGALLGLLAGGLAKLVRKFTSKN